MIRRTLLIAAILCSLTSFSLAQGGNNPPDPQNNQTNQPTPQEMQAKIDALEGRIKELETKIADLPAITAKLNDIANTLNGIDVTAIQSLGAQVQELNVALSNIATQSGDGYKLDILGKMSSDANFREEMRRATQGKIMFNNTTGFPQVVYINGTAWNVGVGESYIMAPVGNVSAQMAYFDLAPKSYDHWKFEDNEYRLTIDIR